MFIKVNSGVAGIFIYSILPKNNFSTKLILEQLTMVATLGNIEATTLKPGAILTVTGANNEADAKTEVANFLQLSKRDDLGYFLISKDYFLLYPKSESSTCGVA